MNRFGTWAGAAVLALAIGLGASVALAQPSGPDGGGGTSPNDRAASFQAVEGPQAESIAGGPLMLGAYAVIWLLVLGYVARLAMQTAKTERDVARLEQALAKAGKGAAAGDDAARAPKKE